ncbi:MAG: hypothetical protein FWD52_04730 [Candidatus Bathyarchaeota archaeon]|nr:hypothetical protein [Candidatus Termiticorpusculum sp.]
MRYQCAAGHIFLHPTIITTSSTLNEELLTTQTSNCPHCHSLSFDEAPPTEQTLKEYTNVLSVPVNEINKWLDQGYKVEKLYEKTAILVKTPPKPVTLHKDVLQKLEEAEKNMAPSMEIVDFKIMDDKDLEYYIQAVDARLKVAADSESKDNWQTLLDKALYEQTKRKIKAGQP